MTQIMKKMHSPRNFASELIRCGSTQTYQNVSLARSIMLDNHKASLRHYSNASSLIGGKPGKQKNMGSLMNTSSQFDKNASTTIDGTQVSLQHYDVSLRTDVDAND